MSVAHNGLCHACAASGVVVIPAKQRLRSKRIRLGLAVGLTGFCVLLILLSIPTLKRNAEEVARKERIERENRIAQENEKAELLKKKQEEARILAEEERVRGPKPKEGGWGGVTLEVYGYLKANLRDPDSLQIAECSAVGPFEDDRWAQRVRYRAKNGFGGYMVSDQIFVIRNSRVVDVFDQ